MCRTVIKNTSEICGFVLLLYDMIIGPLRPTLFDNFANYFHYAYFVRLDVVFSFFSMSILVRSCWGQLQHIGAVVILSVRPRATHRLADKIPIDAMRLSNAPP